MKYLAVLPRFRRAYGELDTLALRESWSRNAIEEYQLARINDMWKAARTNVPYYQNLSNSHSLPRQFASLGEFSQRMPLLEKSVLRGDRSQMVSTNPGKGSWYRTGGTTGAPMSVFRTREAHLRRLWAQYRFFESWNIDILDRTVHLWGHGSSLRRGLRGRVDCLLLPTYDSMRRRLRLSAYSVTPKVLRGYLKQIARFQPRAIYAYSSAAYLLAREALDCGFQCDSLRAVILTSEPAFPHIVSTVEKAFGVPAINEYGSIETGFIAGEARDRALRVREDYLFLETLPADGDRYKIVMTCLTNPDFPLLRYVIGDLTSAPLKRPASGFAILKDVAGRQNQFLRSRSGRFLHGTWFEEIVEQYPAVRRYRLHQRTDGSLQVQLELAAADDLSAAGAIQQRFQEHLEGYPVEVSCVSELQATSSGKHTWITSEME